MIGWLGPDLEIVNLAFFICEELRAKRLKASSLADNNLMNDDEAEIFSQKHATI